MSDDAPRPAPPQTPLPRGATARRRIRRFHERHAETPHGRRLRRLALAALGVVFGDIGTSPLYALKECFSPAYGLAPTPDAVLGVLSLIVWALILVVSVKYVAFVLELDNRGEGGTLALLALILQSHRGPGAAGRRTVFVLLALFGTALLYGEGIITPAISVLGAVEGLEIAAPGLHGWIVPIAVVILGALFLFQHRGTAGVGAVFGPAMAVWFVTIGALGAAELVRDPRVLVALNPAYAVGFFLDHGVAGALILGAVVLVVTGVEALYADLGHFGRRPIRLTWFGVVLPALLLNYFGQGALLLRMPEAVQNPFFLLAPAAFLYPLVVIATVAAVVASQALISGAFSITQQAVALRYWPRVTIVHTSRAEFGQVYVPEVNTALMIGCLALVVTFGSASALAAAYGIAVTGTMTITTTLFYAIARHRWGWSRLRAGALAGAFLVVDLAFLGATLVKVDDGGWVPLALAGGVFLLMTTWKRGTDLVGGILARQSRPLDACIEQVVRDNVPRVPGTAVFLTPDVGGAPPVLLYHLRHNKALHEHVIILSVLATEVPEMPDAERVETKTLPEGFHQVRAWYGFMEEPDVQAVVQACCDLGLAGAEEETTYYLGRARLLPTGPTRMARWRKRLFALMARNAASAPDFFGLPPHRVVELGARLEF